MPSISDRTSKGAYSLGLDLWLRYVQTSKASFILSFQSTVLCTVHTSRSIWRQYLVTYIKLTPAKIQSQEIVLSEVYNKKKTDAFMDKLAKRKRKNFLRILGSLKGIFQAHHVDPPEDDVIWTKFIHILLPLLAIPTRSFLLYINGHRIGANKIFK